jgi:ABC-type nitrate/sulfonate/bicarbonate transport system ATPase subunit
MICFQQVSFTYPGAEKPIFQNYNWEVGVSQSWSILGSSGCGKTTLLYLLAGLCLPQSGEIRIDGNRLTRPRPQTGLILQDYGLLPWATVRQNASLGLQVRRFYGPDGKHAPQNSQPPDEPNLWLNRLGIAEFANKYPGQLSGGQRQRTAIARTLALSPDLLLMDEPFSSLDVLTRKDLQSLTLQLWREQQFTFVVVTHSIEEAVSLGQYILLLGQTPQTKKDVIENPVFGQDAGIEDLKFRNFCESLRNRMEAK